jgi:hypothetical protein
MVECTNFRHYFVLIRMINLKRVLTPLKLSKEKRSTLLDEMWPISLYGKPLFKKTAIQKKKKVTQQFQSWDLSHKKKKKKHEAIKVFVIYSMSKNNTKVNAQQQGNSLVNYDVPTSWNTAYLFKMNWLCQVNGRDFHKIFNGKSLKRTGRGLAEWLK